MQEEKQKKKKKKEHQLLIKWSLMKILNLKFIN
jgi:hypothetical protein